MATRNRILIVALVGVWLAWPHQVAQARASHVCSDACGSGASCDTECWLTQFDFDQDNPSTTCGDQSYSCCGDGWCDSVEACNVCPDDCGYVDTCQTQCTSNSQCPSGDICTPSRECVPYTPPQPPPPGKPYCGGPCDTQGQCCGNDVCIGDPGQKYCGIPATTYCDSAPSCGSKDDCVNWLLGLGIYCSNGYRELFCDPGIDRCEFNWGFDCPAANSASVCIPE